MFAGAGSGWRDVKEEKKKKNQTLGDLGRQLEEQRKGETGERRTGGRVQNRA